jgi:hypothetical protein
MLQACWRIDMFEVYLGEGLFGNPHSDQARPDRLAAARIQRIDNTVENDNIDMGAMIKSCG